MFYLLILIPLFFFMYWRAWKLRKIVAVLKSRHPAIRFDQQHQEMPFSPQATVQRRELYIDQFDGVVRHFSELCNDQQTLIALDDQELVALCKRAKLLKFCLLIYLAFLPAILVIYWGLLLF